MGTIYKDGINYSGGGGNTNSVAITQAEYDALSEAEKNSDTVYFITDAGGSDNIFYFIQTSANTYNMTFAELKAMYDAKKVGVFMGTGKNILPFTAFIYRDATSPDGERIEIIIENPLSIRYTIIVKPDNSVTVEPSDTNWLTLSPGITYRKKNGVVYVNFRCIIPDAFTSDEWKVIATLPEGFRITDDYAIASAWLENNASIVPTGSTGDIGVWGTMSGTPANGRLRAQISFPV